jgi:glycosyltransferase involved in cell wall biosynthesis
MNHTFAIPVYGSAPRLGALVDSLRKQSMFASQILLSTSTPTAELEIFARQERLPLHVNPQRLGIAGDWNFALAAAATPLVTLAHQDDLYAPQYVARLSAALERNPRALIAFSDYTEHTSLAARPSNINLRIKRMLCNRSFGRREYLGEPRDKRRLLSLGNPICCPSVMFNRPALGSFRFRDGLRTNLDWSAWIDLAGRAGGFAYVRERLLSKGIHAGSETTATIASRARQREDRMMLEAFWPRPIAALLATLYRLGYAANRVRDSGMPLTDTDDSARHEDHAGPLQR